MKQKEGRSGFSTIEALLIVLVIAALAVTGFVVYQHHKPSSPKSSAATSPSQSTTQSKSTTTTQPASTDVYTGWKTYCDPKYHYCFKYPNEWVLSTEANVLGVKLLSPTQAVRVDYGIGQPQGDSTVPFTAESITKLTSANEGLTVIGGYIANNNMFFPSYQVVDDSLLTKYPLTIGTSSQFTNVPSFTVKNSASSGTLGALSAAPTQSIKTIPDVQAWFNSSDAKISLLILKSFYYQPQQ